MATEKQMREAIKTAIEAVAPTCIAISRDAVDWANRKWINWLNSPNDSGKLHGYLITWDGGQSDQTYLHDYESAFTILGAYAWRFGSDASNSYDEFAAEIEAILTYLVSAATRPAAISGLNGWTARIYISDEVGKNIHLAEIRLTVSTSLGC